MNAVTRSRSAREAHIIVDEEGRYLAKGHDGEWYWTNDRRRARPFYYLGSAWRRAAKVGGVVIVLPKDK